MAQQKQPRRQQRHWDTRAWLVGILGGSAGGSLTGWSTYPPIQKRLNSLPSFFGIGHHNADVISGASALVTLLVLPGLLSGLARRWTLWWGLLPLCLFLVSVDLDEWYENGIRSVAKDWWIGPAIIGGCWVISSGPVSLIRWLRVRAVRRHQTMLASYEAMRKAASAPQEGVWPPPPDYRG